MVVCSFRTQVSMHCRNCHSNRWLISILHCLVIVSVSPVWMLVGSTCKCCYNLTWLPQYHCGGSLWNGYRVTLLSIFATSKICTWNVLKTRVKTAIWLCMISCVQLKHLYPSIGQCSYFQHFNTNLFGESEKCWDYYWLILNSNILMLFPKSIILTWHTLLNSSDMPMALE